MERICTKCGNPIEDGDSFCDACGTKFEEVEATGEEIASEDETPEEPAEKKEKPAKKPAKKTDVNQALEGYLGNNKKKIIGVAVAVVVLIAAILVVCRITAKTPEAALRKAMNLRLSGNVVGSADMDYDCNFSSLESKEDAIARMKGNAELNTDRKGDVTLRIKSENHLMDDEKADKHDLTNRKEELKTSYRDTDSISDIRQFTYDLMDGKDVKYSGVAEAIKVGGKWYVRGVAGAAFTF